MMPYLALLLLPLCWAAIRSWAPRREAAARLAIFVALLLFIGLRREVGGDWDDYLVIFDRAHRYDIVHALAMNDAGYMMLARVAAALGLGAAGVNAIIAAIFAGGLMAFCARRPSPPVALLVAIPVLVTIGAMGFTRQAAGAGLIMAGLAAWRPERRWPAIALFVAAPLFHWSAVIGLVLAAALQLRWPKSPWAPILFGFAVGAVAVLALTIDPHLSKRLSHLHSSGGAMLRMAPSAAALVLHLLLRKRVRLSREEEAVAAVWCGLTAFLLPLLLVFPTIADRFNLYLVIFQMTVASNVVGLAQGWSRRAALAAAVSTPFMLLFAGWLTLSPYRACWMPYRTYLGEPQAILLGAERPRADRACSLLQSKFIAVTAAPATPRR
jgi:hypothetical protein